MCNGSVPSLQTSPEYQLQDSVKDPGLDVVLV